MFVLINQHLLLRDNECHPPSPSFLLLHNFKLWHKFDFSSSQCPDVKMKTERANVSMSMSIAFAALIVKKQREEGRRTSTPGVTAAAATAAADSENGWRKRG
jgi:hypothetical protein